MNRNKLIVFGILTLVVLLAACSASNKAAEYRLELTEYAFTPASLNLKVGQTAAITLVNNGQLTHEVMFGRDVKKVNNRPTGYQTDVFALAGAVPKVEVISGNVTAEGDPTSGTENFMLTLPKTGDSVKITFTVTEAMLGDWEMGCFAQDGVHYDAGMKGALTITQ